MRASSRKAAIALAVMVAGASADPAGGQIVLGDAPRLLEPANVEPTVALEIRVRGVTELRGQIRIAVFDRPDAFTDRPAFAGIVAAAAAEPVWIVRVPPGRYAVAVIHDRNSDGRLSRSFLGMPNEPYGFSNDARGLFGPPSFDDAAFDAEARTAEVVVEVR